MLNRMMIQVLRQGTQENATNPFLAPHLPDSLTDALEAAERGDISLNPPVTIPQDFRGRIGYDRETCIGCKLCLRVCPANAIEHLPEEKKIQIHVDRCCFCEQCVDVCPVSCLWMTDQGLNSSYERTSEIVRDSGKRVQATDAPADAPEKKKLVYEIGEGCIGCTKCARLCPVEAISGEIKKPHVIDPEKCIGCSACADACPVKVIHTAE